MSGAIAFGEALRTWGRIGLESFGGPAGQIAVMHRVLVDEKRWISEERFLHALSYCMLLPGPEAQQLATYVGWLLHGTAGGLAAGLLFVIPGAVVMLVLSSLYAAYGALPLVAALFFGIKSAVLALVLEALVRIARRALQQRLHVALAIAAFVAIFAFGAPFPAIVAAAAAIGLALARLAPASVARDDRIADGARPHAVDALLDGAPLAHAHASAGGALRVALVWAALWLVPVAALAIVLGRHHVFTEIAVLFSKLAVVTFGGAYAVLAYVAQQAVATHGWLAPNQMLDGLGLAETTPGPLILVLQFVAYLAAHREPGSLAPWLAGTIGSAIALWVTFVPCFLWIFAGAPYIERVRGNAALRGALSGITAAVVGVVANLAVWFSLHVVFGSVELRRVGGLVLHVPVLSTLAPAALAIALLAILAVFRWHVGMFALLAESAAAGLASYLAGVA